MVETNLSSLALQDLHNTVLLQLNSMPSKYAMISILNQYNDELVSRNEKLLSQNISKLISDIRSSNIDNQWVIDKIKGYLRQQHSKSSFHRQIKMERIDTSLTKRGLSNDRYQSALERTTEQRDYIIDTKNWSKQSNWLIIDNLINKFKVNTEYETLLFGLNELRSHLSATLVSKKMRELGMFINDMKMTKRFDIPELIKLLRSIQSDYR